MSEDLHNSSRNMSYTNNITIEEQPVETLVFQCSHCSSIVGDTTAWACADDILRTLSLKQVSEKLLTTDVLETSKNGTDIGSTYNVLKCEICNEDLGKMYRTTPIQLDHLRGLFTLFVEKISSYQIGSSSQNSQTLSMEDTISFGECRSMNTKLQKIQQVVVSLDTRIKNIESFLCEEYDEQSDNTENLNSAQKKESEVLRQDDGYVANIKPVYQQKELPSMQHVMSGEVGFEPKMISPRQKVPSFQPARQAFNKLDEANVRDCRRAEVSRRQSGEGDRADSSRTYIETLKRKLGSSTRADNFSQQTKRSKF